MHVYADTDGRGRKMIEGEETGKANEENKLGSKWTLSWLTDSVFLNQIPFLIRTITTEKMSPLN